MANEETKPVDDEIVRVLVDLNSRDARVPKSDVAVIRAVLRYCEVSGIRRMTIHELLNLLVALTWIPMIGGQHEYVDNPFRV